jgi:hypothetical protein
MVNFPEATLRFTEVVRLIRLCSMLLYCSYNDQRTGLLQKRYYI